MTPAKQNLLKNFQSITFLNSCGLYKQQCKIRVALGHVILSKSGLDLANWVCYQLSIDTRQDLDLEYDTSETKSFEKLSIDSFLNSCGLYKYYKQQCNIRLALGHVILSKSSLDLTNWVCCESSIDARQDLDLKYDTSETKSFESFPIYCFSIQREFPPLGKSTERFFVVVVIFNSSLGLTPCRFLETIHTKFTGFLKTF